MTKLSKYILTLSTFLVACVGFLPTQSVLCIQGNGSVALELGLTGACGCNAEIEDDHNHSSNESCSSPQTCPADELSNSCQDSELQELITHTRQNFVAPVITQFNIPFETNFSELYQSPTQESLLRFTKPRIPPPHLERLEITQVLI
jgi:hypothetical protein